MSNNYFRRVIYILVDCCMITLSAKNLPQLSITQFVETTKWQYDDAQTVHEIMFMRRVEIWHQ